MAKVKYIQWRADDNDRALAQRLAIEYGVTVSDLFRFALNYIDTQRPPLTLTITSASRNKPQVKQEGK